MSVTNHALVIDFPEHKEQIQLLESTDPKFKSLSEDYHALDREVRALEDDNSPTTDEHMNELKMRRAHLKDQLFRMITA